MLFQREAKGSRDRLTEKASHRVLSIGVGMACAVLASGSTTTGGCWSSVGGSQTAELCKTGSETNPTENGATWRTLPAACSMPRTTQLRRWISKSAAPQGVANIGFSAIPYGRIQQGILRSIAGCEESCMTVCDRKFSRE